MEMALRIYHSLEFNFKLAVNPEFQECIYCLLNFHAKPPSTLVLTGISYKFFSNPPRRASEASNSGIFDGLQKLVWPLPAPPTVQSYPYNGCPEKCK